MKQDRELAGNRYRGSSLGNLTAALDQAESPTTDSGVCAERPQDMLRTFDQQRAQVHIAGFRDVQLWIAGARLVSGKES